MMRLIGRLFRSQSGVTAIEYALMAGCIALVIVVSVAFTGTQLNAAYSQVGAALP